jgi:hypothetical protein
MRYLVFITGNTALDQINLQIAGEEAGASEFKASEIAPKEDEPDKGQLGNKVTFETLPAGTVPKELKVVKHTAPQPPGTKKVWEGAMIVAGTNTDVIAYRTV